jgi:hypothetical protein
MEPLVGIAAAGTRSLALEEAGGRIRHVELFMISDAGHSYVASDPVGIHQRIIGRFRD